LLKLRDLSPSFIRCVQRSVENGNVINYGIQKLEAEQIDILEPVSSIGIADGIKFLCPRCFRTNRGAYGTHNIILYFAGRNAPPHLGVDSQGRTNRWDIRGNDYCDLTLSPSIDLVGGCKWHGVIEHGEVKDSQGEGK
jgi:hypothetical protein